MRRKYIIQVLVVSLIIGLGGYTYLGGWRSVALEKVTLQEPYTLVGIPFKGKYDDDQLERNFRLMKGYLEKGQLKGSLAVLYFQHPEEHEGEVDQMMGVLYTPATMPDSLPAEVTVRELPAKEYVRATLTAHVSVMHSPARVREKIFAFAQEQNLVLDSISIEKIITDWHLEVEMPVAESSFR